MKEVGDGLELSASDLVGYLNCHHLSALDRAVAEGNLAKPKVWDPLLEILRERGSIHEANFVDHLRKAGLETVRIDDPDLTHDAVAQTLTAMKSGVAIIVQGALRHNGWNGRPDILRRVETPSAFGAWSYEAMDTKLARETKAGTILQLCLYSDLLWEAQGLSPEYMDVVVPWSGFEPQRYRFADYAAYFRKTKKALRQAVSAVGPDQTYPDPKEHCEICRWRHTCDKRRRDDDHLCLVAGISKIQINELRQHEITTLKGLAAVPMPLGWKPERGAVNSYTRIREQARIQVEARETGERKFELLPVEVGFGLTCLPEPSDGDIFLDFEGDPFVGEQGLEYLCGYQFVDDKGATAYKGDWAFSRADEKRAFEAFVDFVMDRWERFPDLHIYHYAPYEPAALKRLMGRYATREEEIDRMLRSKLFVDLYGVVRRGLRASVESYSIKQLEPFYAFERRAALADANVALANLQASLELEDVPSISEDAKCTVLAYNQDDCRSAACLRDWLEILRAKLIVGGAAVPRPEPGDGSPNEKITDWLIKINELFAQLTTDIPADPEERDDEQQARWLLANIIDWHRREQKAVWWDYFRLSDLSAEDLLDEPAGLSGLTFIGKVGGTARAPIHRYRFPPQETELRGGEELRKLGGKMLGTVVAISFDDWTVEIKKRKDSVAIHPEAVFAHKIVDAQVSADALVRIADYVVAHGLRGEGPYQAARDLLLKESPRLGGAEIR